MNEILCPACSKPLTSEDLKEALDLNTKIDEKWAHSSCYYEKLGEAVEDNPITRPPLHHGPKWSQ